jgi:hypothetical protein
MMTNEASPARDPGVIAEEAASLDRVRSRTIPIPGILLAALALNLVAVGVGLWMLKNAFIILDETAPVTLLVLAVANFAVLMLSGRRIKIMRGVEEQRRFIRVDLELDARLNGIQCCITELSLGGCQVEAETRFEFEPQQDVEVEFSLAGLAFELAGEIREIAVTHLGSRQLRIAFRPGQNAYLERLAMGMLTDRSASWAA